MKLLIRYTLSRIFFNLFLFLIISFAAGCKGEFSSDLRVVVTTDVHGNIFSNDLVSGSELNNSMSRVSSFLKSEKKGSILVLDNGDNLQGTPAIYFYNFENRTDPHLWADVLNFMEYDAVTVGNHDLEAGHDVYDRIREEYSFPMLAANAISIANGEPYFEPYTIINRGGLKIAIIGLITPGVPGWIPEVLYRGMEFEDMVESAARVMPEVLDKKPDLVIGLFHAGWDEEYGPGVEGSYKNENASLAVARQVPGFDLVFIGHDHDVTIKKIINSNSDTVIVMDGGSHARFVSVADITVSRSAGKRDININAYLVKTDTLVPDDEFNKLFSSQYEQVHNYVKREIGVLASSISTREAFFGDSPFMDLIHTVQLETTGADISFAAPLSYDISIPQGRILVEDMFDLYRYENMLYTIELSGIEVDSYLEYSYSLWIEEMKSTEDNLLKYENRTGSSRLKNRYYNFDSAEGINYVVDVSRSVGDRVMISGMTDGSDFDPEKKYKVALNSYRGSGGGGHLKSGCGFDESEIAQRLINSTEKDLRFYMIKWFEENGNIDIVENNNWSFVPSDLVERAIKREYKLLFSE